MNNLWLDLEDIATEISSSITYVDGAKVRGDGAVINRTLGITPFDMIYAENVGVDIDGWIICDGKRQADALDWSVAADRFSGWRFINCTGTVSKIAAKNTVNGEAQAEGNRAAIVAENCGSELYARFIVNRGY